MASVPFTLFFMVFLLGLQVNMVRLHVIENSIDQWPEKCEGRNYCSVKPKDYPSEEILIKLFDGVKIDMPPMPTTNETVPREGENICRFHEEYVESVYMIKDQQSNIRYALNIPELYTFQVQVRPCHEEQRLGAWNDMIKCVQGYTKFPLIVLSRDKTKFESSTIDLPTTCTPLYVEE